jgi:hypothetical protein
MKCFYKFRHGYFKKDFSFSEIANLPLFRIWHSAFESKSVSVLRQKHLKLPSQLPLLAGNDLDYYIAFGLLDGGTHHYYFLFSLAMQPSADHDLLVPRGFLITHNDAPQSVGILWTSDHLVAETST